MATLKALSGDSRLQFQDRNCGAYSCKSAVAKTVAEQLGIHYVPSEEGIMVEGMRVCPDAFVEAQLHLEKQPTFLNVRAFEA